MRERPYFHLLAASLIAVAVTAAAFVFIAEPLLAVQIAAAPILLALIRPRIADALVARFEQLLHDVFVRSALAPALVDAHRWPAPQTGEPQPTAGV